MNRLTLIWGVLLLAGTSMVEIYATSSTSAPVQSSTNATTSPISTQTSLTTATHKTSDQTTHTTHAPTNTTTHAPSNTTTQPTTPPVLPTKPSTPTTGDYRVKDGKNNTCVIAEMGLELELGNSTNAKSLWYFNVNPEKTTTTGTCGNTSATLNLEFPQGFIQFVFVKDKKVYYIDEVSANFSWSSTEHWNGTAKNQKLLSTDVGHSVKCKRTPTVKLASNLQLIMADVKLQAFDIEKGAFGKETVCTYDRNIIAVAVAVTVLIVIIIGVVICCICYKRRSSGYQRL